MLVLLYATNRPDVKFMKDGVESASPIYNSQAYENATGVLEVIRHVDLYFAIMFCAECAGSWVMCCGMVLKSCIASLPFMTVLWP